MGYRWSAIATGETDTAAGSSGVTQSNSAELRCRKSRTTTGVVPEVNIGHSGSDSSHIARGWLLLSACRACALRSFRMASQRLFRQLRFAAIAAARLSIMSRSQARIGLGARGVQQAEVVMRLAATGGPFVRLAGIRRLERRAI